MYTKPIPCELLDQPLPPHVELTSGCWVTRLAPMRSGYVRLQRKKDGRRYLALAHRVFYERLTGVTIPPQLTLDHLCRNRACVRPRWAGDPEGHTEPVTIAENVLRGIGISALNARKTHCKYGHALTPDNLRPTATRQCIHCHRRRSREFYHQRKAALA